MNKFLLILIALIAVVLVAAVGFGAIGLAPRLTGHPAGGAQAQETVESTLASLPANATTDDYWNILDLQLVEAACLQEVKKAAGSNAWAVFSCSCTEETNAILKNYSCNVNTAAGAKLLSASCNKQRSTCAIEAEGQRAELSFEQIINAAR